jgi:hypothetical protein
MVKVGRVTRTTFAPRVRELVASFQVLTAGAGRDAGRSRVSTAHDGARDRGRHGARLLQRVSGSSLPGRADWRSRSRLWGRNPALQIGSPLRSDVIMWRQRPTRDGSMKPAGSRTTSLTPRRPLRKQPVRQQSVQVAGSSRLRSAPPARIAQAVLKALGVASSATEPSR